jgi:mannose-6-phosphate isomerase-like protein (cupin superfamily)
MNMATTQCKVLSTEEGMVRHSVPGETLLYKVSGHDTDGALDYFVLDVQPKRPKSGPPLHIHHRQSETIHFLRGRYKVQIGQEVFTCEPGSFVYIPIGAPHAFLNIGDELGKCIVTFTPGGSNRFFEEFAPVVRGDGPPDEAKMASIFHRHGWELIGPPLSVENQRVAVNSD